MHFDEVVRRGRLLSVALNLRMTILLMKFYKFRDSLFRTVDKISTAGTVCEAT